MSTTDSTASAKGNGPAKAGTPSSGGALHGVPALAGTHRRHVIVWTTRLLLGAALGFGLRVLWERKPAVRFATGLAVHSLRGSAEGDAARPSHLQAGIPVRFSLDEITSAAEPAVALRTWREAFAAATAEARQHCLSVPVEASPTALRRCLAQLAKEPRFREEFLGLTTFITENLPSAADSHLLARSFAELARVDAGLALDGAEASGDEEAKQAVWLVIAEDNPQRVLDLIASGQAPAEVVGLAITSLAARSADEADAAVQKLPEEMRAAALARMAEALARVDPVKALGVSLDAQGQPDPKWVKTIAEHVPVTKVIDFLLAIEGKYPELLSSCGDEFTSLASDLAQRDPGFALGWLKRTMNPGSKPSFAMGRLLGLVAFHQPQAAAEALIGWPKSQERIEAFIQISQAWMQSRPLDALEWMSQQSDSAKLLGQAAGSQIKNPEAAAEVADWFSQQGRLTDLGWSAGRLAGAWAASDPSASMAWARTLPDPKQRGSALGAALRQWMALDPASAEASFRELAAENPSAVLSVLGVWDAPKLPTLNKTLLENLPSLVALSENDEDARLGLQSSLAGAVVQRDTREEALAAVASLPNPEWRQRVLADAAQRSGTELSVARRVTSMITDQAEATRLMEASVQRAFR